MGRCPKDRGAALLFFFCDFLTWDDVLDQHGLLILPLSHLSTPIRGQVGRSYMLTQQNIDLENQTPISQEKKSTL